MQTPHELRLPDGRDLGYACSGDPDGIPVLHFHGGLSSKWEGALYDEAARGAGLRLISVDRPGIGESSADAARTVRSFAADVAALLAHLSISAAGVIGVSGGAPYALACAHALPASIRAVTVLVGLADVTDPTIRTQLAPAMRGLFGLVAGRFSPLWAALAPAALMMNLPGARRTVRPWLRLVGRVTGAFSPADRRALTHPRFAHLLEALPAAAFRAPYAGLGSGPAQDVRLLMQPWTFALGEIAQPVQLWYGEADLVTPVFMGEHLQRRLPDATLHVARGQGHISMLFEVVDEVLRCHAATWPRTPAAWPPSIPTAHRGPDPAPCAGSDPPPPAARPAPRPRAPSPTRSPSAAS